jgi:hypothetical protein
MKRELLKNVAVFPYTSAAAQDRDGFLSAVLGVVVSTITGTPTSAKITVTATECDTVDGTYTPVADALFFAEQDGVVGNVKTISISPTDGGSFQVVLDLVGAKQFIKLDIATSFTGGTTPAATTTSAIALGDSREQPVE